jgi:hypothetical protein
MYELKKGLAKLIALQTVAMNFTNCQDACSESYRITSLQEFQKFLQPEAKDGSRTTDIPQPKPIILEELIDRNYEPTTEEITEYAAWLGMDLETERDLFWIARTALKEPVPKPWKACRMDNSDDIFYFNFETGDSIWDHPCDIRFKQMYEEEKKKRDNRELLPGIRTHESGSNDDIEEQADEIEVMQESPRLQHDSCPSLSDGRFGAAEDVLGTMPHDVEMDAAPVAPTHACLAQASSAGARARRFIVSFPKR